MSAASDPCASGAEATIMAKMAEGFETYDFLTEALHSDVYVLAHVLSTG